jgi:menaquinone-dependent protoporphyrinogen IX oxidase
MNICVIHDSQKGNGKKMAATLASEFESQGAKVEVGHRTEIAPEQVAENPPDLLIVGAAVRKFVTSPPVKQWISRLAKKLEARNAKISHAAVFLTHAMPDKMVEGRVMRLQRSLSRAGSIGDVYSEWLSGRVKSIEGPFVEGTLEKAASFAADLYEWVRTK